MPTCSRFLIAILITVLINVIALFLSVLLNSKIAFKNGFRAIFFIPYTLSVLVIGYVFKYHLHEPPARARQGAGHQVAVHLRC